MALYRRGREPHIIAMAVLKIARMGHPVLRGRAEAVEDVSAPEIHTLVADMMETLADIGGAGLAAPQVHVPLRVVLFHVPAERIAEEPRAEPVEWTVLINPVVTPLNEKTELGWEGCLSVPELRGVEPRHTRVRYGGVTLDGEKITCEASGFHARVVQHECDHLIGILYPLRIKDLRFFGFEDTLFVE